ncbi:aspartate--tRNA ligase [Candidatus Woesearchaeota archaeon]|nr:aspartate--tRNA ligase [Candidatus Woesearchaeota archaeon]
MLRTHTCGELRKADVGKQVQLAGWLNKLRTFGSLTFIDIRDRYGITQVVVDPKIDISKLKPEFVIQVKGKVVERKDKNKELPTGDIEITAQELNILNTCDTLPMSISEEIASTEETRLKYRYLDLRKPAVQNYFAVRHKAAMAAREYLSSQDFMELETPMLVKSTPEGARDYVVPSRVNPGKFYALPQSPQLYKQILMVAGFDRYFQLPRCLRDEDLRQDRQPEHTQIDLEMSYVSEVQDIWRIVEGLFRHIFKKAIGYDLKTPFPVISWKDSMDQYGIDKPDIRYDMRIFDVSDIVRDCGFGVFKDTVNKGGVVKGLKAEGCGDYSRKDIDRLTELTKVHHAKGLVTLKVKDGRLDGSAAKFLDERIQKDLIRTAGAKDGDLLLFIADEWQTACTVLGQLRIHLGKELKLFDPSDFKFCWISDFPLFEWNKDEKKWDPAHHMFCMPKEEHIKMLETDPGKVFCTQYDVALNGVELGSGSIRINRPDIQEKVMKVIGMSEEEAQMKFGFLLNAFRYGAPPHGGIGIGFDRVVALMCRLEDIREVILFPKNKSAQCPMDDSPSVIDRKQLDELNIDVRKR